MMSESLPLTRIVAELPPMIPFVGPETLERRMGRAFDVRVGANESAFGISPKAREAMSQAVERVAWYNDPDNFDLRTALSARHGVELDQICVSAGIDDLLGLIVRIFVEPGDPVVASQGSYPTFAFHVSGFGGRAELVPYVDDRADLDGLLARVVQTGAHLVYLANPDNPMGRWHEADEVVRFLQALPVDCIAILDEAYADFAPCTAIPAMDTADRRTIRTRTFSKAHGMAGARIGYALAQANLVVELEKVRNHFGVNRVAQAGALASLEDEIFVQDVVAAVAQGRADYARMAQDLGLATVPSATNFLCFDMGSNERAVATLQSLQEKGVFVRMPGAPPQNRCIRVTVGLPQERRRFEAILKEVLQA